MLSLKSTPLSNILSSTQEYNHWIQSLEANPQTKSIWTRLIEFLQKVIEDAKLFLSQIGMTAEEKANSQRKIEYLENIKKLYGDAIKASEKAVNEIRQGEQNTDVKKQKNSGAEFSLKGNRADGIEVYETSEDIKNIPVAERKRIYVKLMSKVYAGRTARFVRNGHVYYAEFDKANLGKPMYGDKRSSNSGIKALTRIGAGGDIFDLVENSVYDRSASDTKSHKKTDYFDYFIKTVQIDNKVYDLLADVKKKYGKDSGYVYSITLKDNKKIKAAPTKETKNDSLKVVETTSLASRSVTSDTPYAVHIVSQNLKNVKTQNSLKNSKGDNTTAKNINVLEDGENLQNNSGIKSAEDYNVSTNNSLKENGTKAVTEKHLYTEKEYRNFGWARANNILNAGQNADYRSKFADAKAGRARFNKSKSGEYIIPVSDIYDVALDGIDNVLVFTKGTITNPVITSVIAIFEYDETILDNIRRQIYDGERRGIQQEIEGVFRRYNSSSYEFKQSGTVFEGTGYSSNNGQRGRSSEKTSSAEEKTKVSHSLKTKDTTTAEDVNEFLNTVEDMQNGKKGAKYKLSKYVDNGMITTEVYQNMIEKYGAIPEGEKPHREIQVPRKTAKSKKVSQTVRTILEAKSTPDEAVPTIEKMVKDGVFSYDAYTDKQAINDTESYLKEYGWAESLNDWLKDVEHGVVSKQHTVMGWALYNNSANIVATTTSESERKTAIQTSLQILDAMVRHQRNAA
ncbi:MAG: hypothetical protein IJO74_02340 [Clostridia bacterium]|nr:hypothetical protein [Clostridia bacterium]